MFRKNFILILTICFLAVTVFPVLAVDFNENKQIFTLEDVQNLAVENSRTMKTMKLTVDQADRQERISKRDLDKLRYGTSIELYDSIKGLKELESSLEALKSTFDPNDPNDELMINNIDVQLQIAEKSLMDLSQQRASISSIQKQLKNAHEIAEDLKEDMHRMQRDLEKQLKYQAAQLMFNIFETEDTLKVLEKTYNQLLKQTEIERVKKDLGMSTAVDIDSVSVKASSVYKQLQVTKENYNLLKRNLNDMIGRDPSATLELVRYNVTETLTPAPAFQSIIDEVKQNTYDLYKLDRKIENLKDEYDDTDGSNEEIIKKHDIEKAKLEKQGEELEISNKVRSLLTKYSEKLRAYQLAQISHNSAQQSYNWEQKKFELGMISRLQLMGSEISYLNAYCEKEKAAYDYYLVKNELELAKQGVFISGFSSSTLGGGAVEQGDQSQGSSQ